MRRKLTALVSALLLCLSGCMMDVESYLQPPRAQGQQQAVQDALEAAILPSVNADAGGYTLKYPTGGSISSAFVLLDAAGALAEKNDAVMAVAFYALTGSDVTRIHLLRRVSGGWVSAADTAGEGRDIDRVMLGDLDGDGVAELLIGWNLYSSDRQLSIYRLQDNSLQVTADAGRYTECHIGDLTDSGSAQVLLLHIGSGMRVTATLRTWTPAAMQTLGVVSLDGHIRAFDRLLEGNTSLGSAALYVDAVRDTGTYVTEMLYWDGKRLAAPLTAYGKAVSERAAHVPVLDADLNGVADFPQTIALGDAAAAPESTWQWLTEWYSWDVASGAPVRQLASIVNRKDGYLIELEDDWVRDLTVRYDESTGTLWLETASDGEPRPFLAVRRTAGEEYALSEGYTFEPLSRDSPFDIWYDTNDRYRLTMEKISYMLVAIS